MSTSYATPIPARVKDLTGQRFGYLLVIRFAEMGKDSHSRWVCRCDCGMEKIILRVNLGRGTKSCGCHRRERNTTHGLYGTVEHKSWANMLMRCRNPNIPDAKHYVLRGITVCDRWRKFENFIADMGPKPSPKHTIERIDNDGNYEPENCKWATRAEQMRNIRSNHLLTFNGKIQCMAAWASETGISRRAILDRLNRGWAVERALTTSTKTRRVVHSDHKLQDGQLLLWKPS